MKLRILLAVAAAVVTVGCARFDTRMEMRRFFKSSVEVTDTLGCIYERNMTFECIDGGYLSLSCTLLQQNAVHARYVRFQD